MKKIIFTIGLSLISSTVFGVDIEKKAHDQALKDLELSKKQASLLLKDELKKYDLSRLPPHYRKMLDEQLFGKVLDEKAMAVLKAKYDKVVNNTLKVAADGKDGDYPKLSQVFKEAIEGKAKLSTVKVPLLANLPSLDTTGIKNSPEAIGNSTNSLSKAKLEESSKTETLAVSRGQISKEDSLKLKGFVKASKVFLKKKNTRNIFDRHSEVYLNNIYKKIQISGGI